MLCVYGMFPYSYDTNVCFGVVSRLAYAAWPNCDSSHRVPVVLRMRGGVVHLRGKLPVGCSCCRLKFFVCVLGVMMLFSSFFLRVFYVLTPDVGPLDLCTDDLWGN